MFLLFIAKLFINKWQLFTNKVGLSISKDNWWLPLLISKMEGILSKIAKIYWLRKLLAFPSPSKSWKKAAIDNTADENL